MKPMPANEPDAKSEEVALFWAAAKDMSSPKMKPTGAMIAMLYRHHLLLWFAKSHAKYIGLKIISISLTSSTYGFNPAWNAQIT